jgi:predicted Zn-dependent protease
MIDRGLYVTRFHYVNGFLDTRQATMTGMTRDGTFLIDRGELGGPVLNLRFTDSLLDALSESRLGGIGRDLATIPNWSGASRLRVPAVVLRGFRFTS